MILDRIRTSRRKSLELLFLGGLLSAPRAILAQTPGTLPGQPIRMAPVAESARPAWPASHLTAVSNVDQPVRVEYCPRPHYPHTPPVLGYPVTVELVFVVDTRGRAEMNDLVVKRATDQLFVPSARRAGCRFEPARADGHPVRFLVQQAVVFHGGAEWPF